MQPCITTNNKTSNLGTTISQTERVSVRRGCVNELKNRRSMTAFRAWRDYQVPAATLTTLKRICLRKYLQDSTVREAKINSLVCRKGRIYSQQSQMQLHQALELTYPHPSSASTYQDTFWMTVSRLIKPRWSRLWFSLQALCARRRGIANRPLQSCLSRLIELFSSQDWLFTAHAINE